MRAPRGLQGPRHRSGGHDPAGGPRHPLHVHDAEAARVAGAAARVDGHDDSQGGHHRHLLRRHRVHAAVEPLRARGAARRRLHDADLRQHADGPGGERADRARTTTTRLPTTRRSRARSSRSSTSTIASKLVEYGETGPREADDADEGILRARDFSSATKASASRRTRNIRGTASAACGRTAASRRRRRSACTKLVPRFHVPRFGGTRTWNRNRNSELETAW